jgi:hypothetical protein
MEGKWVSGQSSKQYNNMANKGGMGKELKNFNRDKGVQKVHISWTQWLTLIILVVLRRLRWRGPLFKVSWGKNVHQQMGVVVYTYHLQSPGQSRHKS